MSVIACIVPGIMAGAIAEHLADGREPHGIIVTCPPGAGLLGAAHPVESRASGRRSVRR